VLRLTLRFAVTVEGVRRFDVALFKTRPALEGTLQSR
jgi:hypothetical protein